MKDRHSEVSERYIVRVYRRAKDDPKAIDGVVEVVDEARSVAFHDLATLCDTFLDNRAGSERKGSTHETRIHASGAVADPQTE